MEGGGTNFGRTQRTRGALPFGSGLWYPFAQPRNKPSPMKITNLRANHFDRPLGCDLTGLSLSWVPESDKAKSARWSRVRIAADPGFRKVLHDSGEAEIGRAHV